MSEYISRDAVLAYPIRLNHYDKENGKVHFVYGVESVMEYVESLPAADVQPVVHARYITNDDGDSSCSNCGEGWLNVTQNYCPNCGAKMDAEVE